MAVDFKVGDRAYYLTDGGRIPCNILELPFVNEPFTIRLPFALDRDSGTVIQATLSELDIDSESEDFEIEYNTLILEKLELENKIKLLEEKKLKRKFDNVIKHIESRGYCESLIRKDINTLFPTRLFAFGFELVSIIPYSTEREWNGKLTRMDYRLDFVMCVFDEVFPILTDLRFLTKLDNKLIEQFEKEQWNSPDLLVCLCKQEQMNNKYVYCCIEEKELK